MTRLLGARSGRSRRNYQAIRRGHETFDVYDGATFVGSVWHYHDGWVASDRPQMHLVDGVFYPTPEQAAAVLTGKRP